MQGALKRGVGEEKFVKSEDVMKGNPKLKAVWDSKFNGATFDPNNKEHVKLADEAQFEYDQAVKKKDGSDVIVQRFGNANAKAMGEAAYRAFSAGVKTSAVWDKTKPGLPQFEAGTAKDIRTLIQDGNVKPSDFQAVGVISAAQGLGQGHQLEVTVKGKTYLMQLDDVATNPYTKAVADAYGSVLNSQIDGGLIPTQSYDANKNPIFAQPIIRYEKGNFVNDMKAFFMSPDREYHPMPSNPKDYNGNPITYQTIFDNIENPVIQSYLPLVKGADKFGTSPLPR